MPRAAPRLMKMICLAPLARGTPRLCGRRSVGRRTTRRFAPPLGRGFQEEDDENQNDHIRGLAILALSAQVIQAQNLEDLAQRLVRQTDTLAQRSYDSFGSRRNPSRYDIEALYQSRSLNASAELFQRMVRDRRSDSELRDAFAVLQDLFRNSGRYAFDRRYWSDIQRTSDDLARELNVRQRDPDDDRPPRNDPRRPNFRAAALARHSRWRNPAFGASFRCGTASPVRFACQRHYLQFHLTSAPKSSGCSAGEEAWQRGYRNRPTAFAKQRFHGRG